MGVLVMGNAISLTLFLALSCLAVANDYTTPTWQSKIFEIPDLRTICKSFKNAPDVNPKCVEQLSVVCGNMSLFRTMVSASSKFPYTGIGYASNADYGNYDQCLAVNHTYAGGQILGKYCRIGLVIKDIFENISLPDPDAYYSLSVCRPNGCNADDYNEIVLGFLDYDFYPTFTNIRCVTSNHSKDLTAADIITIIVFVIVVSLMVTSTIYDVYLYKNRLKANHSLFIAFSILSNGRKLLHVSSSTTSKENIEVLHGIRVFSMIWIIAGHGYMGFEDVDLTNKVALSKIWLKQLDSIYITTAYLAVDTFFYMAGFLVAFQYLKYKAMSFKNRILGVPKMYMYRYLRLTPPLFMIYLVIISLYVHLGDGPLWRDNIIHAKCCRENWWAFFLYIQNYHNDDDVCIPPTWFLSAVMQMFLLSPLVLIPLAYTLKKSSGFQMAMTGLLTLNVLCVVMPVAYKIYFPGKPNMYETHSYLVDYIMGMTLAVFMREKIDEPFLYMIKQHRRSAINFLTWTVVLNIMFFTLVGYFYVKLYKTEYMKLLYYCTLRPFWSIGLSWIIYSCHHGYGGFINWILSRPIYQVLSRLSYSIYLVHQPVIDYYATSTKMYWYVSDYNAFYNFCGHYTVSTIIAIFWTLAFESPVFAVEKYLIGANKSMKEDEPSAIYNSDLRRVNVVTVNETSQGRFTKKKELGNYIRETTINVDKDLN